jgi:hypothetical protein
MSIILDPLLIRRGRCRVACTELSSQNVEASALILEFLQKLNRVADLNIRTIFQISAPLIRHPLKYELPSRMIWKPGPSLLADALQNMTPVFAISDESHVT